MRGHMSDFEMLVAGLSDSGSGRRYNTAISIRAGGPMTLAGFVRTASSWRVKTGTRDRRVQMQSAVTGLVDWWRT